MKVNYKWAIYVWPLRLQILRNDDAFHYRYLAHPSTTPKASLLWITFSPSLLQMSGSGFGITRLVISLSSQQGAQWSNFMSSINYSKMRRIIIVRICQHLLLAQDNFSVLKWLVLSQISGESWMSSLWFVGILWGLSHQWEVLAEA